MLCEKCGQNQATVHVQQNINGQKSEMNLCPACAANVDIPLSFDHLVQAFLDSFTAPQMPVKPIAKCPTCGLTFADFKNSGRLGCADCYNAFRAELDLLLKNIQSSNKHFGKFPRTSGTEMLTRRRVETLRAALAKAVEGEEYEEAARLRDEIRKEQGVLANE